MTDPPRHRIDVDPVLAVSYLDGTTRTVGIRTLLEDAAEIADLAELTPPEYAVWRRFLACFVYRITGLDARIPAPEWHKQRSDLWDRGHFDATLIANYFDKWGHRLDLFDEENPWMQEPRLRAEAARKAISAILIERPTGVNQETLFTPHHAAGDDEAPVEIAQAVAAMLRHYGYAAGGRMGSRTLPNMASRATGFAGPLRARVAYFPMGDSLFHSLTASLVPPISLKVRPGLDLAPWESGAEDPSSHCPPPTGIVSLLSTQHQRAVLLDPGPAGEVSGVWESWRFAQKTPDLPEGNDPFFNFRPKTEKGVTRQVATYSPLGTSARDAWRDLPALLPQEGASGVAVIASLAELAPAHPEAPLRLRVISWFQDPAQARDGDWLESNTPPVQAALWSTPGEAAAWRAGVAAWVASAEEHQTKLTRSLRKARQTAFQLERNDPLLSLWPNQCLPNYWARAYQAFDRAFEFDPESGDSISAIDFARKSGNAAEVLLRISRDLYQQVTAQFFSKRTAKALIANQPGRFATSKEEVHVKQPATESR